MQRKNLLNVVLYLYLPDVLTCFWLCCNQSKHWQIYFTHEIYWKDWKYIEKKSIFLLSELAVTSPSFDNYPVGPNLDHRAEFDTCALLWVDPCTHFTLMHSVSCACEVDFSTISAQTVLILRVLLAAHTHTEACVLASQVPDDNP